MKTTTTIDTRKTLDSYDIESLYDGEWSVECSEYTLAEARKTLKEYRDNCPQTSLRIKHRIEKNPNFILTLGDLKKGDWFTLKRKTGSFVKKIKKSILKFSGYGRIIT